jgi:hypothetical protein
MSLSERARVGAVEHTTGRCTEGDVTGLPVVKGMLKQRADVARHLRAVIWLRLGGRDCGQDVQNRYGGLRDERELLSKLQ